MTKLKQRKTKSEVVHSDSKVNEARQQLSKPRTFAEAARMAAALVDLKDLDEMFDAIHAGRSIDDPTAPEGWRRVGDLPRRHQCYPRTGEK